MRFLGFLIANSGTFDFQLIISNGLFRGLSPFTREFSMVQTVLGLNAQNMLPMASDGRTAKVDIDHPAPYNFVYDMP
jgi:hypothetical protein